MTIVKQISVFLENKPGELKKFAAVLHAHHIDMRALSVAESQEFGVLRLIVDNVEKTSEILKEEHYICAVTPVLAVEIPDSPGGLNEVLDTVTENDINLEYMYAFTARKHGSAYMVFRVENVEKVSEILVENGLHLVGQDEIASL